MQASSLLNNTSSLTPDPTNPTDLNPSSILAARLHFREKIPNTDLTLHWDPTTFTTYKTRIGALISDTKYIIATQIALRGSNAELIRMDSKGSQSFRNSVHNGIDIQVENIAPHAITWGDLQDLLLGLGEHCWQQLCAFEFQVGKGPHIGRGKTYKVKL